MSRKRPRVTTVKTANVTLWVLLHHTIVNLKAKNNDDFVCQFCSLSVFLHKLPYFEVHDLDQNHKQNREMSEEHCIPHEILRFYVHVYAHVCVSNLRNLPVGEFVQTARNLETQTQMKLLTVTTSQKLRKLACAFCVYVAWCTNSPFCFVEPLPFVSA